MLGWLLQPGWASVIEEGVPFLEVVKSLDGALQDAPVFVVLEFGHEGVAISFAGVCHFQLQVCNETPGAAIGLLAEALLGSGA